MLHEVDQSLRNMLVAEFKKVEGRLIADEAQITVGPPPADDHKPKKPILNLFLHDLHESPTMRNFAFETKPSADDWEVGRSLQPTHLNLSYLITAHAEDPITEHRLLGEVLGIMMRHPYVETQHLVGSLTPYNEDAMKLSIAQRDHFAHGDSSKVWQATGLALRPFVGLMVAAMFDPFETRLVKRVREAIFSLGHEPHPQGEKRQMDLHRVRIGAAGMVIDSESGDPLVDVAVSVEGHPEKTLTDASGVFFFRNLPVGRHKLEFKKATYKTHIEESVTPPVGRANEMKLLEVKMISASDAERRGTPSDPNFQVPGAELIGTLRFADGSPAAYIPVRVNNRTAVTDGDGQYHFTNVPGPIRELVAEIPGEGEVSKPIEPKQTTVQLKG